MDKRDEQSYYYSFNLLLLLLFATNFFSSIVVPFLLQGLEYNITDEVKVDELLY